MDADQLSRSERQYSLIYNFDRNNPCFIPPVSFAKQTEEPRSFPENKFRAFQGLLEYNLRRHDSPHLLKTPQNTKHEFKETTFTPLRDLQRSPLFTASLLNETINFQDNASLDLSEHLPVFEKVEIHPRKASQMGDENQMTDINNNLMTFQKISPKSMVVQEKIASPSMQKFGHKLSYSLAKMNSFQKRLKDNFIKSEAMKKSEHENIMKSKKAKSKKAKRADRKIKKEKSKNALKVAKFICYCKKSNCKKEYCICFKQKVGCSSACGCNECKNEVTGKTPKRTLNSLNISPSRRLPSLALTTKVAQNSSEDRISKTEQKIESFMGCNCKKSNCTKKYCDCFSQNFKCNEKCHCLQCNNK